MDINIIQILHEHYNESFSHILAREKKRDHHFLLILIIIGVLFFQINYPTDFLEAIGSISISGTEVNIALLPFGALLSITWTIHLVFTLRYCQSSIYVDRQYDYLHNLEQKISSLIGEDRIFSREGSAYLEKYPPFSNWAWFLYVWVFPAIIIISINFLLYIELTKGIYQWPYKSFDILMGIGISVSYILYRVVPLFRKDKE